MRAVLLGAVTSIASFVLSDSSNAQHNCPAEDLKDLKTITKNDSRKIFFKDKESLTTYVYAANPLVLSERLLGSSYMLLKYFSLCVKKSLTSLLASLLRTDAHPTQKTSNVAFC